MLGTRHTPAGRALRPVGGLPTTVRRAGQDRAVCASLPCQEGICLPCPAQESPERH